MKINYNEKTYDYKIWKHPEDNAYFVELTDETKIPIEIVKKVLEEEYGIQIEKYCQCGHKGYEKDNYKVSNEFCYYFAIKSE